MGMYTEVFARGDLRGDTPYSTIKALRYLIGDLGHQEQSPPMYVPDHPLFNTPRWYRLGRASSYYFPDPAKSQFTEDFARQGFVLHSNIKNYNDEIEKFFDWIEPYIDAEPGEFIGYSLYEEGDKPTLYFKKEN